MTHAQFKEQLPLYVVGALDGAELREFEQYVSANRAHCEAEIAEFQRVADQLAFTAPPATPSPQVFNRIMTAIEQPARTPVERREPARVAWLPWVLAAAACVAVVAVYSSRRTLEENYNAKLSARDRELAEFQQTAAALRADMAQLKRQNDNLSVEKATLLKTTDDLRQRLDRQDLRVASLQKSVDDQTGKLEVLMDPAIRVAQMTDPAGKTKATAKIFWNEQKQTGVVVVSNVSPLLPGDPKTLELWLLCDGQAPVPAGLFTTDKSGYGIGQIQLAQQIACAPKFAVSVEPAGGVLSPTGAIILLGN